MLRQKLIEQRGFRSLCDAEVEAVAGGNPIVVTGSPGVEYISGFLVDSIRNAINLGNIPSLDFQLPINLEELDELFPQDQDPTIETPDEEPEPVADPDPSPVNLDDQLAESPSSPPSVPSESLTSLPGIDIGNGVTVQPVFTGSFTDPSGGGIGITIEIP